MEFVIGFKLLFLAAIVACLYYAGKALCTISEHQISLLKDTLNEWQYQRRLPHLQTRPTTHSDCKNIGGLSFGKQVCYEQDFYLNTPVGERRVISQKTVSAPELRLDKVAPQLAYAYINLKLSGLPTLANQASRLFKRF